jgi:hypothetical protein
MRRDDLIAAREQRLEVLAEAKDVHERAKRELRTLTDDEQQKWDQSMREAQKLNLEIESMEEQLRSQQQDAGTGGKVVLRSPFADDADRTSAIRDVKKGETRALSTSVSTSPGTLSNVLFDRLRGERRALERHLAAQHRRGLDGLPGDHDRRCAGVDERGGGHQPVGPDVRDGHGDAEEAGGARPGEQRARR